MGGRMSRQAQLTREPVVDQIHTSEPVGGDQDHEKDMDARCYTQAGNVADACHGLSKYERCSDPVCLAF